MADSGGNNTTIVIKKIKKGGHGHHGGAWKVAYADFVTAMMAFFLVMWIVAMSQDKKEAIQNYFQNQSQNSLFNFFQGVFKSEQGQQMMPNTKRGGVTNTLGRSFEIALARDRPRIRTCSLQARNLWLSCSPR